MEAQAEAQAEVQGEVQVEVQAEAQAEVQVEVQADGVGTAAQPSLHPAQSEGSKLYLAAHQPAFERALLLAVRPHVETRSRPSRWCASERLAVWGTWLRAYSLALARL